MRFVGIVLTFCATPLLAGIQVAPSRVSLNPTLHETVTYTIKVTEPGTLTVRVLDRDTYVTRTLATNRRVTPGPVSLAWDGTDDEGKVVADEAWSLRVDLRTKHGTLTYFPASAPVAMVPICVEFYSDQNGLLRYTLPVASRVHIQAGIADHTNSSPTAGAVMKTLVNRAPRPSGAVIEQWTGMDESGTIYVPALQNFVVAIAATPLPENAVITYGNRGYDFIQTALRRTGTPLLAQHHSHAHHQGLSTLDDMAPQMTATPRAQWHAADKTWVSTSGEVAFTVALTGATVSQFAGQPARLVVYVDQQRVIDRLPTREPITVQLPNNTSHIVAVNWVSDYGPVAATAFRVHRATQ